MTRHYTFQYKSDRAEYVAMGDDEKRAMDLIAESLESHQYGFVKHVYNRMMRTLGSVQAIIQYETTPRETLIPMSREQFDKEYPNFDEKTLKYELSKVDY
jgi:hypothetical protein